MRLSSRSVVSSIVATSASLGYGALRVIDVFAWECTVRYLNPWQHALSCAALEAAAYLLIFVIVFLVTYHVWPHKKTS